MASANVNVGRGGRLKSWKEIAAFFGTDERTVRRWEERGLPVRRIPGGARATVYADVAELERWMRGRDGGASAAAATVPPPPSRKARVALAAGAATLLVAAAASVAAMQGGWFAGASVVRHQPPQKAVDLYLAATFDWEKRTPESLRQARDLYGRAIAEDPAYAEAYAGLANSYLLLREYSGMPDAEAYPRAEEAAKRALSLDPGLADAHAALAFVTFFWTRDWQRGLESFRRATQLNPASAEAWHWYGTALYHSGRVEEALHALGEAQRLEPASRSILADKALVTYHAGRRGDAVAMLRQLTASDPEFISPHVYLAYIAMADGDDAASLREARIAARLKGDREQVAAVERAEQGYRRAGDVGMVRAMLADAERLRQAGRGSVYEVAAFHARLGDKEPALQLLAASNDAGESAFVSVRMDPRFRGLRGDPRFRMLAAAAERPPPRRA